MDTVQFASDMGEAWGVHCRVNRLLLDSITAAGLAGVPAGMKGRSVGEIFAHLHNARLMWLELTPELLSGLHKIPAKTKAEKEALTHEALRAALAASAAAVAALLQKSAEKGKAKGFKRSPLTFFSYVVSHEAYHHGEICMTLTQAGQRLPDEVLYGMWEWDKL
ncbi:MAG: DinB family protein [Chloroflexi bacterium]|nr:DinB family protein [Chloroflexota bacterium]